jgi:GNAT superfamily N-acetyltransferase
MTEISVREATLADLPHILRQRRLMFYAMGERDNARLDAMQASSELYFRSALVDGSYRGWIAETADGKVVAGGGIVVSPWPASPPAPQARRATILNMYTELEFRRRGIARHLILRMLDWLERQGFVEVSLHASDFGRPLYELLGFLATNEMRLALPRTGSARPHGRLAAPRAQAGDRQRCYEGKRAFSIRKAKGTHATSIQRCLAEAFQPFQALYTPEGFADTVPTLPGLQQRLSTMCLFVAEVEGEVIGTIGCSKLNTNDGHLRGMAVLPEWQGSGVAAALLAAAEAELRKEGCTCVKLDTTEPLQRATRFYQKHGFRAGRVGDFFGMRLHEYVKHF